MDKVEWRSIADWPYEVSSTGLIRNVRTGRILKPMRTGTRRPGAQRSKVRVSSTPRVDIDVAHAVLAAFVGPRPEGYVAMHADDDSANNAISNLSWGTPSGNAIDCARKGRTGGQKLSHQQCVEIKARRLRGESGAALAKEFQVSQQRICDILKGRSGLAEVRDGYAK